MTMYHHAQGGAEFYDLSLCHSAEQYLASLKLWKKPKPKCKAQ